jgi:signal transduction histidine kinase
MVSPARIEFGEETLGDKKVLFVRDNGLGFEMKDADKLFEPFLRLQNAKQFKGTGIGLATVQRVIQLHKGALWGVGEPGRGATFYFTLAPQAAGTGLVGDAEQL